MKVLFHFENNERIFGMDSASHSEYKRLVLKYAGVEYTEDPDDDYDILHINTVSPYSEEIIKKARKKGAAVIYQISSFMSLPEEGFISDKIGKIRDKYLCKLYGKADYLLTSTLYYKNLVERCGVPMETFSFGVNFDLFTKGKSNEKLFRDRFGFKNDDKIILCAGARWKKNGIEDFIRVAELLPHVKFLWLCDERAPITLFEIRNAFKELPPNVIFAEDTDMNLYVGAFSSADMFFFPGYECPDDTVLLEALASGKPLLVRDSLRDVHWLDHGRNCFMGKSETGFAMLIDQFYKGELPDITEQAFSFAAERSVEKVGRHLHDIYEYVYNDAVTKLIRAYSNLRTGGNSLNIGLFSDTFTPDVNGVSVSVATLKTQLERMGHNVYVVTPSMETQLTGVRFENGILRIPGIKLKQLYGYRLSRPYSIRALEYIRRMKLDVIHVHTEFSMRFLATAASSQFRIPLVSTYHTMYEDYTHYVTRGVDLLEDPSKKIVGWYTRKLLDKKGEIVVPSEKTYNVLKKYGMRAGIHIVPTGIDTKRFDPESVDSEFVGDLLEKYCLKDKFRLIYIGRLAPEKGTDLILQNMPEILRRIPDAHLTVVGYGPSMEQYIETVKELGVEDRVLFLGKQPPHLIQNFYALGNVFVTASTSETQGITYIEAMAGGLPVIARYDDVLKSVLVDGKTGLFFDNEKDFVEKVCQYYALSAEEKLQMRTNALAKAEEYSLESFGNGILNVYLKAIKRNSIRKAAFSRIHKK